MGDISVTTNRVNQTLGEDLSAQTGFNVLSDMVVTYRKTAADGMAATTTANDKFFTNPFTYGLRIISGGLSADAGLTADAANKARVQIKTDDNLGGTPAVALEWETNLTGNGGTGNWVAGVSQFNFFNKGSGNNQAVARLVAGACMYFAIAKDGTGVVVPICSLAIRLVRVD